jgi:hypothetical protein
MRYFPCDAMRIVDGAAVAERPVIDSRTSISLPCAAVRVPDVPLDTTASRAPRPLTTRPIPTYSTGGLDGVHCILSCPGLSTTAKGRASGIVRLPPRQTTVMSKSGAPNLTGGKKAAHDKAEFEIVRSKTANPTTCPRHAWQ